jgi:hypothetical protein
MFLTEFVRRVRRKADIHGVERLSFTLTRARARAVPQRQTLETVREATSVAFTTTRLSRPRAQAELG